MDVLDENGNKSSRLLAIFDHMLPSLLKYPDPANPLNLEAGYIYSADREEFKRLA